MANNAYELDLKQTILYGGSFGPTQIKQLREAVARDMKKFDELKEAVNELKSKDPDELSPAAYVKLGVCQFLIGKYDDAAASLQKGDGGALAYFYFAKLRLADKNYDGAIEAYNTAQKAGYNGDVCALGRAEAYREMGKLQQSLQELDCLSGAIEQTADYLYQRAATVNAFGGNLQEAINLYERAIQVDPNHPGALYGLALENDRRGNDDVALEYYKRAAAHFPTNVGTLVNLGILLEDMGAYDQAVACYQRVLEAEPNNDRAKLFLKDALATESMFIDDEVDRNGRRIEEAKRKSIDDFELSVRARNCLREMGVATLGDLCKLTEKELLDKKNFGETSLGEVREVLRGNGLHLGMTPKEKAGVETAEPQKLTPDEQAARNQSVDMLNLSVRARKCMNRLNISTIGELISRSADELLDCKNFGVTSLKEIREKLVEFNVKLRGD